MTVQTTKLITADELFEMGDIGRCELIRGEIIPMAPAGSQHGKLAFRIGYLMGAYVMPRGLGEIYAAETGFTIARHPDTTRAPDVAFVRTDRVPLVSSTGFFSRPPDLAIEVISPGDTHSEVVEKVNQWLAAGSMSVWVVDPPSKTIEVYRQGHSISRYFRGDELRDEPTLPGFTMAVDDLFSE